MAGEVVNASVQNFNASQRLKVTITFGPTTTSGTSTATTATTLVDIGASWVVNAYAGLTVYSNGSSGVISSNTSTALTVASWTGGTPTAVKPYMVAAAGVNGPIGTIALATVSGVVLVRAMIPICTTTLTDVGAGATLAFGTTNNGTFYWNGVTATNYTSTNNIAVATATREAYAMAGTSIGRDTIITASLKLTVAVENITAGVMDFYIYWDPVSAGATLT